MIELSLSISALAQETKEVLVPRETFIDILSSMEFLSNDRDLLIQQVGQLTEQVSLLKDKDIKSSLIISELEDIQYIYQRQEELFNEQIDKLYSSASTQKLLGDLKDYSLVGLLGVVAALIVLGL